MAIFCHKCGTQAKDDESVFCNRCGTQYIQNIPEKKDDACQNCGTKILDKQSVFCNNCGSQVSAISPNQPPTIQPPSKPNKSTKTCPHCNGPIIDESRYYCDTCGAYLKGSQPPQKKSDKITNENGLLGQKKEKTDYKVFKNQKITYEQFKAYKPNWILILAFAFGLISIVVPALLVIIVIASAIAVYYDAKAIRAGKQITEEATMNTHSGSPLSWGLMVLLLWIIGLPLYLFKRREIFFLNYHETPFSISDERESDFRTQSQSQRTPNIGNLENPQSVTVEFILGLLGGIIGFFAGFAAIFVGGLGGAFGMEGASNIIGLGVGAILFSILGTIGAALVKRKTKIAGYLMIISAVGGLICISAFYILSFILLILGGVLAVIHGRSMDTSDYGGNYSLKKKSSGSFLGLAIISIGVFIFLIIIAAFVFGQTGNVPSTSQSIQSVPTMDSSYSNYVTTTAPRITTTAQQSGVPTEIELSIGQMASNPERQVTAHSEIRTSSYTSTLSSYTFSNNAKSGNTFIFIDAEIKNIGSDRMYASASEFSMSDSEGNRYDPEMYTGDDGLGYFKELYKNQKVRGKVLFEVPQNAKNLILYYDFGNAFSGTKLASWKII